MSQENNEFSPPPPDHIAVCAYLIWEKDGRLLGNEEEHWLQAETQLQVCRAHEEWTSIPR